MQNTNVFIELESIIADRQNAGVDTSYTAQLLHGKLDKLLKKIGEEAAETVIAGKGGSREEVLYESCDLIYHLMVLWAREGITVSDISIELRRRFAQSGLEEKVNRKN